MATPNKDYRENPKRAVYLTGKVDQDLVEKISPKINELRLESTEPITVYIDSPGGSILLAETIRHHLKAPNPDGEKCRLITVVTSRAASAAADFLALGDYAIAYPYADVVYHGTRQASDGSFTTEMATYMARSLQQTNEICARRLAVHAFPRFILRLTQLRTEMAGYVVDGKLPKLADALRMEISLANRKLIRDAVKKQGVIASLTISAFKHLRKFKNNGVNLTPPAFEAEMLRGIVRHKVKLHKNEPWLLSESGIEEITEDFNLLHDFHFGSQKKNLADWDKAFGELFLSTDEKQEYNAHQGTTDEKNKWLADKAEPKLRPLWYLMVSICRLLQSADYTIPATDAYWLGLIDEVPGSSLPSLRQGVESLAPSPAPAL